MSTKQRGRRGQLDGTANAGQRLPDLEKPQVEAEVHLAVEARSNQLVADADRHAKTQLDDTEVEAGIYRPGNQEAAIGADVTRHIDRDEIEEIEAGLVNPQLEHRIDDAHSAPECQIEGEDIHGAVKVELEQRVTGNRGTTTQRGISL